jgi:aryl-alcohol dehydrogenase-like predicted oxidoreductase
LSSFFLILRKEDLPMDRRIFIRKLIGWLTAVLIILGLGGLAYRLIGEDEPSPDHEAGGVDVTVGDDKSKYQESQPSEEKKIIPHRKLGKTGYAVSIYSLGGESTVEQSSRADEAEAIINRAIDLGVNYIDTAPAYGSGGSESNIGRVMEYRREEVFLASKTPDRTYDGTMRQVENSLKRLRTDHLDLYQLHNIRTADDLNRVFADNGAVKALEELKSQGVIRFAGITGHKDPDLLLQGIRQYPFDCLLMSFNAGDIHYASFRQNLLNEAVKLDMGIIAMKVAAVGRIFREGGLSSMKQALGYVFSFPVSTAIVGISNVAEVEENARIAADFKPLDDAELKQLESLTAAYADDANFFKHHW